MKKQYLIVPIVMLGILIALSTPAMGCFQAVQNEANGTITDGKVKAVFTGAPGCENNWTITLPPGEAEAAYAHWHRWGECENHNPTAEFWNGDGEYQNISVPDSLCPDGNNATRGVWFSGVGPDNGTHHYYWKVNASPGDNIFKATGCYDTQGQHCGGRWFVAVMTNVDEPNRTHTGHWWHNFGLRRVESSPSSHTTAYTNASGDPINSDATYTLWKAQSHYGSSQPPISFNGQQVGVVTGYDFSLCDFHVNNIECDGSQTSTWGYDNDGYSVYSATLAEEIGKPDITVTAINNDTIYNSTFNPIYATVENLGYADASDFNVTLSVDSSVVDTVTVSRLNASENTTVLLVWTPNSTSCYTLNVTADADNVVYEQNEENNSLETNVTPVEIPETDLVVTEVSDGNVFVEEENAILAVIENNGWDASGFNVSLEVDGVQVSKTFVPMLFFRSQQLVRLDWTPTSEEEDVQMNITVDCDCEITESEESNNTRSQIVDLVKPTIITVSHDYRQTIQEAIDDAQNDTVILVESGVYNETITIPASKSSIRLIANGSDVVIHPDGGSRQPFMIIIDADNIWIDNFRLEDGWNPTTNAYQFSGIKILPGVRYTVITNTNISKVGCGIWLEGVLSWIEGNTIGSSAGGQPCHCLMFITGNPVIPGDPGSLNTIVGNTFDGDTGLGWKLGWDMHEIPKGNRVYCNEFTVTGVGGYGPGSHDFGGAFNAIYNNKINDAGGTVTTSLANWYYIPGPVVPPPPPPPLMPARNPGIGNVVHGPYYGGNYWTGYTGVDLNCDLIGDTSLPHRGVDWLPLITALCGDVDCDGVILIATDASAVYNYAIPPYPPVANVWAADVDCSGTITLTGDVADICDHCIPPYPPLNNCCTGCE